MLINICSFLCPLHHRLSFSANTYCYSSLDPPEEDLLSGSVLDSTSHLEEEQEEFTEEATTALLASDTEDMEVEEKDDNSSAAGDSFCSAKSSCGESTAPNPQLPTLSRAHNAIRVARLAMMSARSLVTGITAPLMPISSLIDTGDDRSLNSFMVNSFTTNRNISASFDTASLCCVTCSFKPDHRALRPVKESSLSTYSCPAVFVLSDQSFPAYIPTGGEGECLKIIRLEDGSLLDLAHIFLETVKNFVVPAGSVVLLHSLSHLAWVGPAAYAEDLVRARQRICGTYRSGLSVIGGIALPISGCLNTNIVQDLVAISSWMDSVRHPAERDICVTRASWRNLFCPAVSSIQDAATATSNCGQPSAPQPPNPTKSCSKPSALQSSTGTTVQPSASVQSEGDWPSASPQKNSDPCL